MKIGILTFHRSHNYGAYMQAYALVMALKNAGYEDVEIIDYNTKKSEKYYLKEVIRKKSLGAIIYACKRYQMFRNALNYLPISEETMITDDMDEFALFVKQKYDVIITGSDEVWRLNGMRGFPNPYWLPDIDVCYKIAYAVSARNNVDEVSDSEYQQISELTSSFDFISVRDEVTKQLIEHADDGKHTITRVCDPTMAYTFQYNLNEGKRILKERFGIDVSKKCIGVMSSNPQIAQMVVRKCRGKVQVISLFSYCKGAKNCASLTPFEWYQVIGALDGLITTYFHGMCFAINGNTPFILLENRKIDDKKYSKSYDLLSRYKLEDLYFQINSDKNIEDKVEKSIDNMIVGSANSQFSEIKLEEQKTFTYLLSALDTIKIRSKA